MFHLWMGVTDGSSSPESCQRESGREYGSNVDAESENVGPCSKVYRGAIDTATPSFCFCSPLLVWPRSQSTTNLQMEGDIFYPIPEKWWTPSSDLFHSSPSSRAAYDRLRPFQVFSTWGGMVVLAATPFLAPYNLRYRRGDKRKEGECQASECELVNRDLWEAGWGRVQVVPSVQVRIGSFYLDLFCTLIFTAHGEGQSPREEMQSTPMGIAINSMLIKRSRTTEVQQRMYKASWKSRNGLWGGTMKSRRGRMM